MSVYSASLILSLDVSLVLDRILVLERARVLSHIGFRLRQNHDTYRSTRRMVIFFFRRLGQDMYVSFSPRYPTAGSQRLHRQICSFHGSLTADEFFFPFLQN